MISNSTVEYMESKQDIIEHLLNHNLTEICFQIFCQLDSRTFANCRLVNSTWKNYIDNFFRESAKGKKWMDQKLYSNFMNPNFQPTIMNTPIKEEIAILKVDQFGIITLACSGTVFCYELYSLELKWWVSFLEFWKHSSKKVPQEVVPSFLPMYRSIQRFPSQGSNLCMNNDRIFIANRIGHLMILNRSNGEKIYEMLNTHKCNDGLLLQVYENSILATLSQDCYGWNSIRFHQINDSIAGNNDMQDQSQTRKSFWKKIWGKKKPSFSLKLLKEEKLLYKTRTNEAYGDHFTHLEHDKNWYVVSF